MKKLESENGMLRDLLRECADEIEAEVNGKYSAAERTVYPDIRRRYERDMEIVNRVRLFIRSHVK